MNKTPLSADLVIIECVTADVPAFLSRLSTEKIYTRDVESIDEVTLRLSIDRKNLKRLQEIAGKRGDSVTLRGQYGLHRRLNRLHHRPVLIIGILILLLFATVVPSRVLLISVEGNERIPEKLILEAAEAAGLTFCSSRRELRSEELKNNLLDAIPELKWAGVNTYGCRAVITVRERAVQEETVDSAGSVSHIIAGRDGIIQVCTVEEGTALCSVGQAVCKGQRLISGFTDCGLITIAGQALGQIRAVTNRLLTIKMPRFSVVRGVQKAEKTRFSLIIGKKQINFYKCSGISGASCVKMKTEYVLTLPGGFTLPMKLVKETICGYSLSGQESIGAEQLLQTYAATYLNSQMDSGYILEKAEVISKTDDLYILTGNYACSEEIGVVQVDTNGDLHGQADGTDRERGSGG